MPGKCRKSFRSLSAGTLCCVTCSHSWCGKSSRCRFACSSRVRVSPTMKAVIVGATGATGQQLFATLLTRPAWDSVVVIHRRQIDIPVELQQYAGKCKSVVIDMDKLPQHSHDFEGADAVFCALGTTRKVAGSAAAFRKVDLDYVAAAAAAAAAAKVKLFSLVSAQGANAKIWASDAAPFHALLYTQVKGKAEEAVKTCGVPLISIFRPGLLDRSAAGREHRFLEELAAKLLPKLAVSSLAQVMVDDAEARLRGGAGSGVQVYEGGDIKKMMAST